MSSEITWYPLEKVVEKYCLESALVLKWAEEGLIRTELPDTRMMRVKVEDIERKVQQRKCSISSGV